MQVSLETERQEQRRWKLRPAYSHLTAFDELIANEFLTADERRQRREKKLSAMLRTEYDVVVGGGQQSMAGKIFRIGHMGYVTEEDLQGTLDALRAALPQVGFTPAGVGSR